MMLTILCGSSGSGKSTYAAKMKEQLPDSIICSADDYFSKSGTYEFNSKQLGTAHSECLFKAANGMAKKLPVLVDNTNVRFKDFSKYLQQASIYGYNVKFIIFNVPKEKMADIGKRNVHNVPEDVVKRQWDRLKEMRSRLKKDMKTNYPGLTFTIETIEC